MILIDFQGRELHLVENPNDKIIKTSEFSQPIILEFFNPFISDFNPPRTDAIKYEHLGNTDHQS